MKQYDTWNLPQNNVGEVRVSGGLEEKELVMYLQLLKVYIKKIQLLKGISDSLY